MHSAVESSVNAIALCDLKGNLTYVNDSFLILWGYDKADEIIGKPCRAFWEDAEKAAEIYEQNKGDGKLGRRTDCEEKGWSDV